MEADMIGTRTPEPAPANRFPATARSKIAWHSISCGSYKIDATIKESCARVTSAIQAL